MPILPDIVVPALRRALLGVVLCLLVGATAAQARPGQVDYSFGYFGTLDVTEALPGPSSQRQALAMAVGPNDETVVLSARAETCGSAVCGDLFVTRFGADGALDQAFGTNAGIVTHVRQELDPSRPGASLRGTVIIDAAGRVVVAAGYDQTIVVDRLNADGSRDPTFHEPGLAPSGEVVRFMAGEATVSGITVMKDGGYLVAGAIRTAAGSDLFLTWVQEQGQGEPRFGPIGSTVFADFGSDDLPTGIALRGGRILVGRPLCCAGSTTPTVAEFGHKGETQSAFKVKVPKRLDAGPVRGVSAVIPSGGKTFVVGTAKKGTFVARYLANGRPDPKYGDRGFALVRGLFVEGPSAAALDSRGRVVLSGWRYDAPDDKGHRARIVRVYRLLPSGGPDRNFGGVRPLLTVADGTEKLGLDLNRSISMALRGDDRIMILGEAAAGDPRARLTIGPWFGLVRVLGGGKVR